MKNIIWILYKNLYSWICASISITKQGIVIRVHIKIMQSMSNLLIPVSLFPNGHLNFYLSIALAQML